MTGRRVLSLLVALWTASAAAQTTAITVQATASLALDAGVSPCRAYVVTGGISTSGTTRYAMANAGGAIEVFDLTTNLELTPQNGVFTTFAVVDFLSVSGVPTTLVVAANEGPSCPTICLDTFYWKPGGTPSFAPQTTAPTNLHNATAMAIDATSSPIRVFFTIQGPLLYEQDLTINGAGNVVVSGVPTSIPITIAGSTAFIQGLTVDGESKVLYFTNNSSIYALPEDGGAQTLYSQPNTQPLDGGYNQAHGLSFYPFPVPPNGAPTTGNPYLLAGSSIVQGVYALNPNATPGTDITIGSVAVLTADGGRTTAPSAAAVDGFAQFTVLAEDNFPIPGGPPWIHVVANYDLFPGGGPPDAGSPDGGDGGPPPPVDAGTDAGGIPTIPIIAPGPGVGPGPTNSCNCSTAGSAPVLLALLLPLLVPRRRR